MIKTNFYGVIIRQKESLDGIQINLKTKRVRTAQDMKSMRMESAIASGVICERLMYAKAILIIV